ncbi:MAG: hypothetical protein RLZZ08_1585 [Pseudomonadota bacterium]|jgi:hypothetical protein
MTPQSRIRRIGWIAALALCTAMYLLLHLKVHAVRSDVVRAERQIVALEQSKVLLETEYETRANQLQLAEWNRVDFGYTAPDAGQFVDSERQLASFSGPTQVGAPEPIRVAMNDAAEAPAYPKMVSPLTGKPIEADLVTPAADRAARPIAVAMAGGGTRIPLAAVSASVTSGITGR